MTSNPSQIEKADGDDPLTKLNLPSPLILGSGSFTRKLILNEMRIPFQIYVRSIDEKSIGDRFRDAPEDLVSKLALAKSDRLIECLLHNEVDDDRKDKYGKDVLPDRWDSGANGGRLILTADQVVTHDGNILEKPESIEQAQSFVSSYARSNPKTVGSVVLTHIPSRIRVSGVDVSEIRFRPTISECDLVDRLVEDGAPVLECAGGLMIEHEFVEEHVEEIVGSVDGVMGLSKSLVWRLFEEIKGKLDDQNGH